MTIDQGIHIFTIKKFHFYLGNNDAQSLNTKFDFIFSLNADTELEETTRFGKNIEEITKSNCVKQKHKVLLNQLENIFFVLQNITAHERKKDDQNILIHCNCGKTRAPFIMLLALLYFGISKTWNTGLAFINDKIKDHNHTISLDMTYTNWKSIADSYEDYIGKSSLKEGTQNKRKRKISRSRNKLDEIEQYLNNILKYTRLLKKRKCVLGPIDVTLDEKINFTLTVDTNKRQLISLLSKKSVTKCTKKQRLLSEKSTSL